MSSLRQALLVFVDERIQRMLARPAAWGSEESVELQVLQLIEVRALAMHPDIEPQRLFKLLQRAYERFIEDNIEGSGPDPLATILQNHNRLTEFGPLLNKFVTSWEYAQRDENPFEEHDIVVRLTLKDQYEEPPTATIGHYYETFRRVVRALARDNLTGRTPKEIEQATDFRTPDLQVMRKNGTPARVVMPLRIPPGPALPASPGAGTGAAKVRSAMSHLITVAEWARNDSSIAELNNLLPDGEKRQRVAFQALRLLPSKDDACSLVELGGREIGRIRPVELSPIMFDRFTEVVSFGQQPTPFDIAGVVRMLDLDQGTLALKVRGTQRRIFFGLRLTETEIPPDLLDMKIRLSGDTYRDPLQRTFSVATKLEVLGPAEDGHSEDDGYRADDEQQ